jgi:hypothetical protein
MNRVRILIMVMAIFLGTATLARGELWQATLTGYEESPVVSTVANGDFRAFNDGNVSSFFYSMSYFGLQGAVTQAHIHVAQPGVNGSIVIWLCQTPTNPDPTGLSPLCPQEGTVSGIVTAQNVIAGSTASQQLAAGDIKSAITAIRAGAAYANVHTSLSTPGEIRGQIKVISK